MMTEPIHPGHRLCTLIQQLRDHKPEHGQCNGDAPVAEQATLPTVQVGGRDLDDRGKAFSSIGVTESSSPLPVFSPKPFIPKRAAVLICLFEGEEGDLRVLLTKRASNLSTHSGEVSLPGGKAEAGDADDCATATREAKEEIGLDPSLVTVVAILEPFLSRFSTVFFLLRGIYADSFVYAMFGLLLIVDLATVEHVAVISIPASCPACFTTHVNHNNMYLNMEEEKHNLEVYEDGSPKFVDHTVPLESATQYLLRVVPVIGILSNRQAFIPAPNAAEVETVFDVPMEMFLKDENHRSEEREWMGEKYLLHYFDYETNERKFMIWGLTASILIHAASVVFQQQPCFPERKPKYRYPASIKGDMMMT